MPHFVSVFGDWKAGKEKVYLPDEERIYEGKDRAALQVLEENGGSLGSHFKSSMDLVMRAKNLGFENVDEYLKFAGYDEKKAQERFDKELNVVHKHELPKRINPAKIERSGGDDTSGNGNHLKGEFKAPPINTPRMKE